MRYRMLKSKKRSLRRSCCECGTFFEPKWPERNCHIDAERNGWEGFYLMDVLQEDGTHRQEFIGLCPECKEVLEETDG